MQFHVSYVFAKMKKLADDHISNAGQDNNDKLSIDITIPEAQNRGLIDLLIFCLFFL